MLNLVYFDLISFKKALLTFKCKINIIRGKSKKNPGYIINIIYTSVYL